MHKTSCRTGNYKVSIKSARKRENLELTLDIYDHYIEHSPTTFHLEPQPNSYMEDIHANIKAYVLPFLVAIKHSRSPTPGQTADVD